MESTSHVALGVASSPGLAPILEQLGDVISGGHIGLYDTALAASAGAAWLLGHDAYNAFRKSPQGEMMNLVPLKRVTNVLSKAKVAPVSRAAIGAERQETILPQKRREE